MCVSRFHNPDEFHSSVNIFLLLMLLLPLPLKSFRCYFFIFAFSNCNGSTKPISYTHSNMYTQPDMHSFIFVKIMRNFFFHFIFYASRDQSYSESLKSGFFFILRSSYLVYTTYTHIHPSFANLKSEVAKKVSLTPCDMRCLKHIKNGVKMLNVKTAFL